MSAGVKWLGERTISQPSIRALAGSDGRGRRYSGNLALVTVLAMMASTGHAAEPVGEVALGAHTLLVQADSKGTSLAITQPVDTQADGSSLLVLIGGYTSNADAPTDRYANRWRQLGHSVAYRGYQGRFDAKAYVAVAAKGGAGHVVSIVKDNPAEGEITVPFVEIRHAGVLQDVAQNYPVPSVLDKATRVVHKIVRAGGTSSVTLTSGEVTTTAPATLVAIWWGDAPVYQMTAVPNNGFKVIDSLLKLPPESAVQCAVATRQVEKAGTYDVSWTGAPQQGAILWLFAFQSRGE